MNVETPGLEGLSAGDLRIDVGPAAEPAGICLTFLGKSSAQQPGEVLGPYLGKAIDAAAARAGGLEVHFERLEYFNSSTIKAIIKFVQASLARKVPLQLVYDERLRWQKLSFDALRMFDRGDGLLKLKGG
jgi:hypothetical protein